MRRLLIARWLDASWCLLDGFLCSLTMIHFCVKLCEILSDELGKIVTIKKQQHEIGGWLCRFCRSIMQLILVKWGMSYEGEVVKGIVVFFLNKFFILFLKMSNSAIFRRGKVISKLIAYYIRFKVNDHYSLIYSTKDNFCEFWQKFYEFYWCFGHFQAALAVLVAWLRKSV